MGPHCGPIPPYKDMGLNAASILKKGYTPLAMNKYAAISWQGEHLRDFWMWNGQFIESHNGKKIQTVRVTDLKEAALMMWRDKWVPLDSDDGLIARMESALRGHKGLKAAGLSFPDTSFLKAGEIPDFAYSNGCEARP